MENNKYYTPTIEEFHVGFEYTKKELIDKGHNNTKLFINEDLIKSHFTTDDIRVKYLDQEDIESLGWKLGILRLFNKDLTLFGLDKYPNYVLTTPIEAYEKTHIIDISRVKSVGQGLDRVFRGTIKNKSELKRLMKQLGINENNNQ